MYYNAFLLSSEKRKKMELSSLQGSIIHYGIRYFLFLEFCSLLIKDWFIWQNRKSMGHWNAHSSGRQVTLNKAFINSFVSLNKANDNPRTYCLPICQNMGIIFYHFYDCFYCIFSLLFQDSKQFWLEWYKDNNILHKHMYIYTCSRELKGKNVWKVIAFIVF